MHLATDFNSTILGIMGNPFFYYPLLIWSLAWKGWALWRAARNEHKVWFVALLIVNTVGILEIIYIFAFSGWKNKAEK